MKPVEILESKIEQDSKSEVSGTKAALIRRHKEQKSGRFGREGSFFCVCVFVYGSGGEGQRKTGVECLFRRATDTPAASDTPPTHTHSYEYMCVCVCRSLDVYHETELTSFQEIKAAYGIFNK